MDVSLGRFGDRRLGKGGPIFWAVSWSREAGKCGSAVWAALGLARSA